MSEDVALAGDDSLPAPSIDIVTLGRDNESTSPRSLADALVDFRNKRDAKANAAPEEAAAEPEPSQDAAPEEATGETPTETSDPVEEQPLALPRSWAKDKSDAWAKLDRGLQEYLLEHDSKASAEVRRSQNETAEQRKQLETKLAEADKIRQQYEQALPTLLQTMRDAQAGEFSDIKTQADIDKLATEDWPRFARWQAHQMRVEAAEKQMQQAHTAQQAEFRTKWNEFSQAEDAKFLELAPEMTNKEQATKIADTSVSILKDIGFTDQDLAKLWNGEASLSLRDHRAQLLLLDAAKYRMAKTAIKTKVVPKAAPSVQKPGVSGSRASDDNVQVKQLDNKLSQSGSVKDATALLLARRRAG